MHRATFLGSEPVIECFRTFESDHWSVSGSDPSGTGCGPSHKPATRTERLSTARQADCKSVLIELVSSTLTLSTNPVGPAWRGERTVNPHAAGSIPAAGATALWCQWLAWLSVEQQDGDRNPVGPPNIFKPRALGPQPSFTRKGGSVQFTDEVPSSQVMLRGSQKIVARLPLVSM